MMNALFFINKLFICYLYILFANNPHIYYLYFVNNLPRLGLLIYILFIVHDNFAYNTQMIV